MPLALEQAASYIHERDITSGYSIAQYHSILNLKGTAGYTKGKPRYYKELVATTWRVTLARLEECDARAIQFLRLIAYFDAENLPFDPRTSPFIKIGGFGDEDDFSEMIGSLKRFSLINQNNGMHRLLQEIIRDEDKNRHVLTEAVALILKYVSAEYEDELIEQKAALEIAPHFDSVINNVLFFNRGREDVQIKSEALLSLLPLDTEGFASDDALPMLVKRKYFYFLPI